MTKTVFFFAYAKTKTKISCAVTAQLISTFVFATWIVRPLFYLNPTFQAPSHLLWLYNPVCVGHGRKPRSPVFSQRGSIVFSDNQFMRVERGVSMTQEAIKGMRYTTTRFDNYAHLAYMPMQFWTGQLLLLLV